MVFTPSHYFASLAPDDLHTEWNKSGCRWPAFASQPPSLNLGSDELEYSSITSSPNRDVIVKGYT